MRTVAGPASVVQWVLRGGPYTVSSHVRQGPGGVTAAVAQARNVTNQHLVRSERVSVGAARRRVRDPLPCRRLHQVAQHDQEPKRRSATPG
jgi:hypothetical protein